MAPVLIAKVALENVSYHFDKAYDYCVPESLRERARPGCRVSVPFGRGNQKRFGMLFSLSEEEPSGRLKQLSCVLDEEPLLNANMLRLAVWRILFARFMRRSARFYRPELISGTKCNIGSLRK